MFIWQVDVSAYCVCLNEDNGAFYAHLLAFFVHIGIRSHKIRSLYNRAVSGRVVAGRLLDSTPIVTFFLVTFSVYLIATGTLLHGSTHPDSTGQRSFAVNGPAT